MPNLKSRHAGGVSCLLELDQAEELADAAPAAWVDTKSALSCREVCRKDGPIEAFGEHARITRSLAPARRINPANIL